jgi:hypothetical protein
MHPSTLARDPVRAEGLSFRGRGTRPNAVTVEDQADVKLVPKSIANR